MCVPIPATAPSRPEVTHEPTGTPQNQMTEATEKGDYKKLRVFRDTMGINLGFMFSAINDYGCSNVNFAVVTQNKPLLVFMAESGADLSMACAGRACSRSFSSSARAGFVAGLTSLPCANSPRPAGLGHAAAGGAGERLRVARDAH